MEVLKLDSEVLKLFSVATLGLSCKMRLFMRESLQYEVDNMRNIPGNIHIICVLCVM